MAVMELLGKVEDVAKTIGVSPSTIKKYYLLFEEEGYTFKRNNEGHVLFTGHDIELLKKLISLKNQPNMTIKKAIQLIVAEEELASEDMTVMTNEMTAVTAVMTEIQELKELVKQQNELLQHQQRYIDERLKERDERLVTALRTAQQERALFMELAASVENNQKKSFWSNFFSK